MTISPEQTKHLTERAAELMRELQIPIRDTWKGYDCENLDDKATNGKYAGSRLLNIEIVPDGTSSALAGPVYEVEGHKSFAHDKFTIHITKKHLHHENVYIHELVHFLQCTCEEKNETYLPLAAQTYEDYEDYVSQRCEKEAHLTQLNYIIRHEPELIPAPFREKFIKIIKNTTLDDQDFAAICIDAKEMGVI